MAYTDLVPRPSPGEFDRPSIARCIIDGKLLLSRWRRDLCASWAVGCRDPGSGMSAEHQLALSLGFDDSDIVPRPAPRATSREIYKLQRTSPRRGQRDPQPVFGIPGNYLVHFHCTGRVAEQRHCLIRTGSRSVCATIPIGRNDLAGRLPERKTRCAHRRVEAAESSRCSAMASGEQTSRNRRQARSADSQRDEHRLGGRDLRSPVPDGLHFLFAHPEGQRFLAERKFSRSPIAALSGLGESVCNVLAAMKTARYLDSVRHRRGGNGRKRTTRRCLRDQSFRSTVKHFPQGFDQVSAAKSWRGQHLPVCVPIR